MKYFFLHELLQSKYFPENVFFKTPRNFLKSKLFIKDKIATALKPKEPKFIKLL